MAAPDRLVRHLSRCRTGRLPLRRRRAALSRRSSGSRPAQPLQALRPWLLVLTLHKTRMPVRYLTSGARQRARRRLPSVQRRIARFRHFFQPAGRELKQDGQGEGTPARSNDARS
jgi:hypothetical protein